MDQEFTLTVVLDEEKDNNKNWTSLHQCLLMLFDSPLNHERYLEVYIRLVDGKVIKMHREVRIPRTFKRFEQLFCNFLSGSDMPLVHTKDGQARLLQFVNKSLDKQLQQGGSYKKYRVSNLAPKFRNADYFTDAISEHKRVVLFVSFGPVNFNILGDGREEEYELKTINRYPNDDEDTYSISRYPLSASLTCVKLTTSFEKALDVF